MEDFPFLTVITPTHNIIDGGLVDEFNILTTLLSKQSYPNIEHLVIDKASTDGTVQLLSDYKSKGYIQFYSEPDMGRIDALNKGIMRAKGKYVAFLNPSDFVHDIMAYDEIITAMEAAEAVYSFGTSYALHPDGYVLPFEPAILNAFQVVPCPLQAMVFRKDVLSQENYFDTKLRNYADYDLVVRLIMKEYNGIMYDKNFVTYKISSTLIGEHANEEFRQVLIKNFRSLYPLTNEILDKMVKFSEFPRELLEKLSQFYPEDARENFFLACEEMRKLRVDAYNQINGISDDAEVADKSVEAADNTSGTPQQAPQQQPNVLPQRPQMPGMSGMPRPQMGMPQKPQMPGMSGQPLRQTNPLNAPRPNMPGMNQ